VILTRRRVSGRSDCAPVWRGWSSGPGDIAYAPSVSDISQHEQKQDREQRAEEQGHQHPEDSAASAGAGHAGGQEDCEPDDKDQGNEKWRSF